jgi:hypothetical protein
VRPEAAGGLAETAFFCPYAKCDVVYFDMFERRVTTDAMRHGVYPKDPQAAICGCFGLGREDVEADIREGTATRVRALLAKVRAGEANCQRMSPSGQPCTAEVQRYYMKLHSAGGDTPAGAK